jgi:acyl-CoA reductase-like NAD-dependent aldehyde dehydrogenase
VTAPEESAPAKTVQGVNPRSGEPVGNPVPETGAGPLADVLRAAAAAAAQVGASRPAARAALLRLLADRLDERTAELAELAARESGLPLPRLTGEVARTSGQLRLRPGGHHRLGRPGAAPAGAAALARAARAGADLRRQ